MVQHTTCYGDLKIGSGGEDVRYPHRLQDTIQVEVLIDSDHVVNGWILRVKGQKIHPLDLQKELGGTGVALSVEDVQVIRFTHLREIYHIVPTKEVT